MCAYVRVCVCVCVCVRTCVCVCVCVCVLVVHTYILLHAPLGEMVDIVEQGTKWGSSYVGSNTTVGSQRDGRTTDDDGVDEGSIDCAGTATASPSDLDFLTPPAALFPVCWTQHVASERCENRLFDGHNRR